MIVAVIAVVGLVSLYALHSLEQFLIRDSRFALNGPKARPIPRPSKSPGANHASARRIEAVFAEDSGRSVYLLPLADRQAALRTVDWVKDASIVRLWPNRIVVRVWERTPVAFITLAASRFGLIDEDGVILPPAPDRFTRAGPRGREGRRSHRAAARPRASHAAPDPRSGRQRREDLADRRLRSRQPESQRSLGMGAWLR